MALLYFVYKHIVCYNICYIPLYFDLFKIFFPIKYVVDMVEYTRKQ